MPQFTDEQLETFLGEPHLAIVATLRSDGRPQMTPVGFIWDKGVLYFSTTRDTVKYKNLVRDGRVTICINDPGPPLRYATIYGQVELDADVEFIVERVRAIRRKYNRDKTTTVEDLRRIGRVLVTVRPERIVGHHE